MTINVSKLGEWTRFLRERYSQVSRDENERVMDAIQKLFVSSRAPGQNIHAFLEDTGKMIHRIFDFQEIAIGLRNKRDGLYRYEILIGFRGDAEASRRKLTYTREEMISPEVYPEGVYVSKYTEFQMSDWQPYKQGEENTYNRPSQLSKPRNSFEDFVEGDYICVYLFGKDNKEVIGWIELSGPRSGKVPDRSTIKWLEHISSVISMIIWEKDTSRLIC